MSDDQILCSSCEREIDDSLTWCPYCGAEATPSASASPSAAMAASLEDESLDDGPTATGPATDPFAPTTRASLPADAVATQTAPSSGGTKSLLIGLAVLLVIGGAAAVFFLRSNDSRGDLSVAMRASMAIPGVFSPVVVGERVMVDGGLMRNIPVDVARELCADVVIAVWFPEPDAGPLGDLSPVSAMYRSLLAVVLANENEQIASLTDKDINLAVPLGDLGSADFDRVPEAIELGREVVCRAFFL